MTLPSGELPIPRTVAELLSPDWLSAALASRFPGIRVTEVTSGPVDSRVAVNVPFDITCEGGVPEGLSPRLWGKGYFSEAGAQYRQAGYNEVSFYRHLAAGSGLRTLNSVYAGVDTETWHSALITQDVLSQGARFLDATSVYTVDHAAESLAQLAKLHAANWRSPYAAEADWLAPRLDQYIVSRGVKEIRGNFESEIGAGVPDAARDAERLFSAYEGVIERAARAGRWTVIHGDCHPGNLYLDGDGLPCLLDWQLVQKGPWYIDVGYHIASVLDVEDRRGHEDDLLRHYLDHLRAGGVDVPSWDEARRDIREGFVHGFFLWGITLKVDPAITSTLLRRLGTAADDHQALAGPSA